MPTPATSLTGRSIDAEQLETDRGDAVEDLLRAVGDVAVDRLLAEDPARQVGDGDAGVGGAEVDREHDPVVAVERETRRRPAAGRGGLADRCQQA